MTTQPTTTEGVVLSDPHEIDALPDRTVVIDRDGDVWQYRAGLWCSYETAAHGSEILAKKFGPVTVLTGLQEIRSLATSSAPDRYVLAQALHDGPNAQAQYRTARITPHSWEDCAYQAQYLADADAGIAAGFHRSEVPEPSDESVPCPECGKPRPFGLDFMCLDCNGVRYVSENDWYAHHGCGFEEEWKYQREAREAITEHVASCDWSEPQGEPSGAAIREAVLTGLAEASVFQTPFAFQTRELVVEQVTLALRAAGGVR